MRSIARTDRTSQQPRGITLLELLIVMVIMLMVTAAAIPMIAPAMRNRQMRESTRLVSAYFGAARARAVQTGRPVGVIIERERGNAFALQMSQVEIPPPYSGDVVGAKLQMANQAAMATLGLSTSTSAQGAFSNGYGSQGNEQMSCKWYGGIVPPSYNGMLNTRLLRVGDRIQFNNQGPMLTIFGPDANSDGVVDELTATTPLDIGFVYSGTLKQALPWENAAPLPAPQDATYRIFRQPVRSSAQPLILPEGIVVDLSVSGVGSERFNITNYAGTNIGGTVPAPLVTADPIIIFSPSGRLDYVTNRFGQLTRPLASVNLLLGRRELMFDVTTKGDPKDIVFQNLSAIATPTGGTLMPPAENFWMTIGYQTGQVSVSQVASHYQNYDASSIGGFAPPTNLQGVIDFTLNGNGTAAYPGALGFAKEAQSLGGR